MCNFAVRFAAATLLIAITLASAQEVPESDPIRLPSGKLQREEILKADHAKSLEDADTLVKLSDELKAELEKNDRYVLDISTLKKLDTIEKLSKRIRSRLKRY